MLILFLSWSVVFRVFFYLDAFQKMSFNLGQNWPLGQIYFFLRNHNLLPIENHFYTTRSADQKARTLVQLGRSFLGGGAQISRTQAPFGTEGHCLISISNVDRPREIGRNDTSSRQICTPPRARIGIGEDHEGGATGENQISILFFFFRFMWDGHFGYHFLWIMQVLWMCWTESQRILRGWTFLIEDNSANLTTIFIKKVFNLKVNHISIENKKMRQKLSHQLDCSSNCLWCRCRTPLQPGVIT